MDLSKYKYLVVCGDSFTQGHIMGETASWAYWTAKELGLELVNLAVGGMANDWIYSKPILWFNKNKDKISQSVCMVCWSDFGRQHTIYQPVIETESNKRWVTNVAPGDLSENPPYNDDNTEVPTALKFMHKNREVLKPYFGSIQDALYKTIQSQLILREYLESVGIPFAFFDAITYNKVNFDENGGDWWMLNRDNTKFTIPYNKKYYATDVMELINKENIKKLFDENYLDFEGQSISGCYINWPGGSDVYEKGNQGHTNVESAQLFAKIIAEKFKKIYS